MFDFPSEMIMVSRILSRTNLLPSANEVEEMFCFYTCLSVSLFTGWGVQAQARGGGVSQHTLNQTPPPADGYCWGRYASYWNAFLLLLAKHQCNKVKSYLLPEMQLSLEFFLCGFFFSFNWPHVFYSFRISSSKEIQEI